VDPESIDFYVNKLGMKKVGEMQQTAANYFAMEEDASEPMLELTQPRPDRVPRQRLPHVAFTVDDIEEMVSRLEEQGVEAAPAPKTMTVEGHDYRVYCRSGRLPYRVDRARHDEGGDIYQ